MPLLIPKSSGSYSVIDNEFSIRELMRMLSIPESH